MDFDLSIVEQLNCFPTTELADSAGPDTPIGVMTGMNLRAGAASFCGFAHTVRAHPGDLRAVIDGVDSIGAHQVLIVDGAGSATGAMFGDIMAEVCVRRGAAGVVVDGAVRDLAELRKAGLTLYSRHVYPRAQAMVERGSVGVPVLCGGITVRPGDVVCADENGIVAFRADHATSVLEGARETAAMEKNLRAQLATDPSMSIAGALSL